MEVRFRLILRHSARFVDLEIYYCTPAGKDPYADWERDHARNPHRNILPILLASACEDIRKVLTKARQSI
jgi:hypothetical protein